jgi:hypothetical protein
MLDFSRLTETLGGWLGSHASNISGEALQSTLERIGVDPGSLEGLDLGQAAELLQQQGIDIAGLDASRIGELIGGLEPGSPAAELLATILEERASQR